MRYSTLLISVFCILFSFEAFAESPQKQYLGVNYGNATLSPKDGGKGDTSNLNLKLGYRANKFLGGEIHLGTDVSNDDSELDADGVQYLAGLLRGNIPLHRINVYGLLGFAAVSADFKNIDGSYTNAAIGAGIELFGNDTTALTAEIMQYGFDDRYKTISLGIIHHFNWPEIR